MSIEGSAKSIQSEERPAGVCYADFQPGDRIHGSLIAYSINNVKLGTVTESTPKRMNISWDNGYMTTITAGMTNDLSSELKGYGKPLDLANLQAGDIISRKFGNERLYAKILEHIPKQFLSFEYLHIPGSMTRLVSDEGEWTYFERETLGWELEG